VGHHEGDPGTQYRTKEEVQEWKRRCPLESLRRKLIELEAANDETLKEMEKEVTHLIDEAVEFAKSSPEPSASTVSEHVY
jgi:TPP-dependent pyruvate/acetoin dehydrogenase alpha subunit